LESAWRMLLMSEDKDKEEIVVKAPSKPVVSPERKAEKTIEKAEVVKRIRPIVANLGLLLQITGLLLILPIAIGLQNSELQAVAGIIATCFLSFGVGFILNSYVERKELDETTSLWLMLIVFTVLPLVLMIPYVWSNVFGSGNPFDLFTNAYFETVSGFTTTGFTFIAHSELLPASLLFYRSLVEFIGGIGFVYLLVAFLYPNDRLEAFAEAFGVEKLSDNLRKVFLAVMLIYTSFVVIFTVIFYFVYSPPGDLVVASCAAIDVLTGGYQPNITAGIGIFQISTLILMLLGSLNFKFHYNLFQLKLRSVLTREIKLYLGIIAGATVLLSILAWVNPFDSLFHVVSMMSSTGIDYINLAAMPPAPKIVFILIGLAGGCTFSMAGGIRIRRIQVLIDALRKKGDKPDREELKAALVSIVSFFAVLLILTLVFSTIGISLLDSLFEVGSAYTTNGISMGITTVAIPLGYKWLLIIAMTLGRIEIGAVFTALSATGIFKIWKRFGNRLRNRKRRKSVHTFSS
jgi:trk system potassium uptake protein TrkH